MHLGSDSARWSIAFWSHRVDPESKHTACNQIVHKESNSKQKTWPNIQCCTVLDATTPYLTKALQKHDHIWTSRGGTRAHPRPPLFWVTKQIAAATRECKSQWCKQNKKTSPPLPLSSRSGSTTGSATTTTGEQKKKTKNFCFCIHLKRTFLDLGK